MDHHQLLAQAAVTATRGAADGVIVQEDHGEQDGQDIWTEDEDEYEDDISERKNPSLKEWKKKPIGPTTVSNWRYQDVDMWPFFA